MRKEEVCAYAIMENVTDPIKPQNVEVIDKNGLFFLRFDTNLQSFNCLNRNRREYLDTAVMEGLRAEHIIELMRENSWMGEAGHPEGTDISRIATILPGNCSHKILSYEQRGKNLLTGRIETLDDAGGVGTKFTKAILQGMRPAFSLRALAKLVNRGDGTKLVQTKPHIVTYDWVILPSHKEAYGDTASLQKITKDITNVGNTVKESCVPILESSIVDYIKEESNSLKVISNLCDIGLESAQLSSNKKFIILKENGREYHVKIEDRVKHDVNQYMSLL